MKNNVDWFAVILTLALLPVMGYAEAWVAYTVAGMYTSVLPPAIGALPIAAFWAFACVRTTMMYSNVKVKDEDLTTLAILNSSLNTLIRFGIVLAMAFAGTKIFGL